LLALLLLPVPSDANWLYESVSVVIAFPMIIAIGAAHESGSMAMPIVLLAGRLSYPVYILHYPIIKIFSNLARSHKFEGGRLVLLIGIEVLFAIGVAYLIMIVVDEPVRSWLDRKRRSWHQNAS
jgi:peptidoglycan/LPS O-acetylase OafA/YrhL